MSEDFTIHWLEPQRLGGCPRPDSLAALQALKAANCRLLISLTAEWTPDITALKAHGIASLHVPIPDFAPPDNAGAIKVCTAIHSTAAPVILHCAAGKGRTGTLLAAYLIATGLTADRAIKKARGLYPLWIETPGQIAFLQQFTYRL